MSLGKTRGVAAALLAVSMLASLAFSQSASAATISTEKACYVSPDGKMFSLPVSGSGYTPGKKVIVEIVDPEGILGYGFFLPDDQGNISGPLDKIYMFSAEVSTEKATLKVRGDDEEGDLVAVPMWLAYREVTAEPWHDVKPHDTVTYEAAGFKSGRPFYAHYLHQGKQVMTVKLGRTTGPCGAIRARGKWFPAKHSHFRSYEVQYDNSKEYKPKAHPEVTHPMIIGLF